MMTCQNSHMISYCASCSAPLAETSTWKDSRSLLVHLAFLGLPALLGVLLALSPRAYLRLHHPVKFSRELWHARNCLQDHHRVLRRHCLGLRFCARLGALQR